ncbi:hypothetical protein ASF83_03870 [Plantibacter sp. Leaf171]|uniref:septation protein SepH n=1 Tax=unclassified Plantibacter TaxID=2624265 RepID=UPI0006F99207|nr:MULTISPECIES: septation protein SepH [unclassified Plantibacter]KQM15145.1 hypothetical protein ASE44_03885 [Plantibacter sp. Leaf1]KQR58288.1 hypothetical protein ASF83_03870 [Plantibacter sp. Leaf171]
MQELKVVGAELGALIVADRNEEEYRLIVDDAFHVNLRRAKLAGAPIGGATKISPREVQAHIRSGLSAEDVAAVTGASLEYVQRFEGPVMAEREHIVGTALGVAVLPTTDTTADDIEATFGNVIRARLEKLGATDERWTSWKEPEGGWIVKLSFTAEQVDHDARWAFEPKKLALTPIGSEATTLSRQGDLPAALIPRLRAVDTDDSPDTSRFDSGAFSLDRASTEPPAEVTRAAETRPIDPLPFAADTGFGRAPSSKAATQAAINREASSPDQHNQTADLLEALRKRRGERESAPSEPEPAERPSTPHAVPDQQTPLAVFDTGEFEAAQQRRSRDTDPHGDGATPAGAKARRGRASMPSWDEIVFGAKSDDDPV